MSLLSRVPQRFTRAILLPGLGLASLTLSAALSLAGTHEHVLRIDPGASNRNVTLDTAAQNKGRWYIIRHVGAANSVVVKDGATTIATLSTGDVGLFVCDGTDWYAVGVLYAKAQAVAPASVFLSTEQTGNGAPQNVAHGLGVVPSLVFVVPSDLTGGVFAVVYGTHTSTNAVVTVTNGEKYRVVAFR